jgi:hypothetical protein
MSDKPSDTSDGSVLDALPKESVTVASSHSESAVVGAERAILNYLCAKYRETGENAPVEWRGLWERLGVPQKAYAEALNNIVNSVDVELVAGHDHIRLGPGGRSHCENKW